MFSPFLFINTTGLYHPRPCAVNWRHVFNIDTFFIGFYIFMVFRLISLFVLSCLSGLITVALVLITCFHCFILSLKRPPYTEDFALRFQIENYRSKVLGTWLVAHHTGSMPAIRATFKMGATRYRRFFVTWMSSLCLLTACSSTCILSGGFLSISIFAIIGRLFLFVTFHGS